MGFEAAGGRLSGRVLIPNVCRTKFERLSCARSVCCLELGALGWSILGGLDFGWDEVDFGKVNDGLGCVNVRTLDLLGDGAVRLVGAGLRNDFGTLGATVRVREALAAGRLGVWIRGEGLVGDGLAAGAGADRAPGCDRESLPRPLNAPRIEFGWAAIFRLASTKVASEATIPALIHLVLSFTRYTTSSSRGQASFTQMRFSR